MDAWMLADLRQQAREFSRTGWREPGGHNRRPQRTPMKTLGARRSRRRARRVLRWTAEDYD